MPASAIPGFHAPWDDGQIRSLITGSDTTHGYEATGIFEDATKEAMVSLLEISSF